MGYSYLCEAFTAWYSMNPYIHHTFMQYVHGSYGWAGCAAIACNVLLPQIFWWRRARRSLPMMTSVGLAVLAGMWFERFVIIVISLSHDFLPSSWHIYKPTLVDYGILLGSFGFFFTCVLLFARVLPVVATSEVKSSLPGAQPEAHHG